MSRRVLFVATVDKGHILKFHLPYLKYFKEQGFEVHVACAGKEDIPYCDKKHELSIERTPFKVSNIRAYKELKDIMDINGYDLIHCHTPVGGVAGRLAAINARRNGTKVIYTAHGFHFHKGASLLSWLLYYPIEKWLSRYTDCLITINSEDYGMAQKYNFRAGALRLVNGVGVDLHKFTPQTSEEKSSLRKSYGYSDNDFILIYTADLNDNKHQDLLINILSTLKSRIPNIKLLLAGEGPLLGRYLRKAAKLELKDNIDFLGYRQDVSSLLKLADVAVSSSKREGLPVNVMEAMATTLPLVVTDCRGNRDLVIDGENGFVIGLDDTNGFNDAIYKLYKSDKLRRKFGERSLELIKQYSQEEIVKEMKQLYLYYMEVD